MIPVGAYHKFTVGGAHDAGDILVFCDLRQNQTLLLVPLKHTPKQTKKSTGNSQGNPTQIVK